MIIARKCDVPEMVHDYIPVVIPNDFKVNNDQVKDQFIKCDGIIIGKVVCVDEDYIYGYVYSPKYICGEYVGKQFTYDVEVYRNKGEGK